MPRPWIARGPQALRAEQLSFYRDGCTLWLGEGQLGRERYVLVATSPGGLALDPCDVDELIVWLESWRTDKR